MRYYIIRFASIDFRTKQTKLEGYCLTSGNTKQEAILNGLTACRKQNNLDSSVYVNHSIIFDTEYEDHAEFFLKRLTANIGLKEIKNQEN